MARTMAFNPLIDQLPTEWRGVKVKTDFRQPLRFFRAVADSDLSDMERAHIIIRLFFNEIPQASADLWEFIENFVSGGAGNDTEAGKKLFDFEIDSGRVLAAFQQSYGIDLTTENMHWWRFLELFRGLPDNTMLAKVIEIRGKEIPKDGDRKYIRDLRRAKRAFSLEPDDPHSVAEFFKGGK